MLLFYIVVLCMSVSSLHDMIDTIEKLKQEYERLQQITSLDSLHKRSSTHLTYTSNALEGNTLSEIQTSLIINDHQSVAGKKIVEIQEAINHARAVDLILERSKQKNILQLGEDELLQIHKTILGNINPSYAWVYRDVAVRIAGSQTILPNYMKIPELIQQRQSYLHSSLDHILLQAIKTHYDIVTIHPFVDGNGRTARLYMNLILSIGWYPLVSIEMAQREQYLTVLENAQVRSDYDSYCSFMLSCITTSLESIITQAQS